MLAAALERLGARGRGALYRELPAPTAELLARAVGERAPPAPRVNAARLGAAEFRAAWTEAWRAWDAIIAATRNEDGAYVRNAISYNSPDLDQVEVARDLDRAAVQLRLLTIRAAREPELVPRFDLARRLVASVGRIADEIATYVIASEDGTPLGAEVTRMVLDWLYVRAGDGGAAAFVKRVRALRTQLADAGLGATLDEPAIARFVRGLPAAARRQIDLADLEPDLE